MTLTDCYFCSAGGLDLLLVLGVGHSGSIFYHAALSVNGHFIRLLCTSLIWVYCDWSLCGCQWLFCRWGASGTSRLQTNTSMENVLTSTAAPICHCCFVCVREQAGEGEKCLLVEGKGAGGGSWYRQLVPPSSFWLCQIKVIWLKMASACLHFSKVQFELFLFMSQLTSCGPGTSSPLLLAPSPCA